MRLFSSGLMASAVKLEFSSGSTEMAQVTYHVVEHDGGWAYKVGDVFSETFRTRDDAHSAAEKAATEQQLAGEDEPIEYQDASGEWKVEAAKGGDRPSVDVDD